MDNKSQPTNSKEIIEGIFISAKIEKALVESEQGLGQDWNEFKREWLTEDQ